MSSVVTVGTVPSTLTVPISVIWVISRSVTWLSACSRSFKMASSSVSAEIVATAWQGSTKEKMIW